MAPVGKVIRQIFSWLESHLFVLIQWTIPAPAIPKHKQQHSRAYRQLHLANKLNPAGSAARYPINF